MGAATVGSLCRVVWVGSKGRLRGRGRRRRVGDEGGGFPVGSRAPDEARGGSYDVAFGGTPFYCKGYSPGIGPRASMYGLGIQS